MAGVSMKGIKLRIHSMESTRQITRAMEMVASSKLHRAQERVLQSRPYFETLYRTLSEIAASTKDFSSPFLVPREIKKVCYVTIAGDRGLAGGYNSNVLKLVMQGLSKQEGAAIPIGKKAGEYFRHHEVEVLSDAWQSAETVTVSSCFTLAKKLAEKYRTGELDAVYLAFTHWNTILSQEAGVLKLLPLDVPIGGDKGVKKVRGDVLYEPGCEGVFNAIIPEYLGGVIYGALCESLTSELSARRMAMDSATQNAEDMIDDLSLQYNRARQGAITRELTEIVAGAEQ